MKIDQIKVGGDYYGWGCTANRGFRLLHFAIRFKYKWTCGGIVYEVCDHGDHELGDWSGYPDNLYNSINDALINLQKKVQELVNSRNPQKKPKMEIVKCSSPYICCATCKKMASTPAVGNWCSDFNLTVDTPRLCICKDAAGYKCGGFLVDAVLRELTGTKEKE